MNLDRLSKKAVSYSSASMTKYGELPNAADASKLIGTPPIRYPGSSPICFNADAMMLEVVVLPWVPATEITFLSESIFFPSHSGPEV